MKTKLMSFDIDVQDGFGEGDTIEGWTHNFIASGRMKFKCVRVDGELVLKLTHFDGEAVPE